MPPTRFIFSILILSCLFSCNTKLNHVDFSESLGGQWVLQGQYRMGELIYDTLETSISNDLDDLMQESRIFTINTDSGVFVHSYSEKGLGIARKSESSIVEFLFKTDTSGVVLDYEMDIGKIYDEHPRIFATEERFWLKAGALPGTIRICYVHPRRQEFDLELISGDSLKIIFEKGRFNLFVRVPKS